MELKEFMGLAHWRKHKGQEQQLGPSKVPVLFSATCTLNISFLKQTPISLQAWKLLVRGMRLRTGLSHLLPFAAPSLSSDPASECSQKALLLSLSGLVEAKQGGRG